MASREACRRAPTGGKSHQTREPRGLSPSGGSFTANRHVSLRPCAQSAQSGVKGYYPLREPWHLSCHGGKTPANLLSLEYPRALWGAVWGAGRREEARARWAQPP